jgi:thiol-disulfide isomerase/thioredoxin
MPFKLFIFLAFAVLLFSCENKSKLNSRGEIKVELSDSMYNRIKGTYFYLASFDSKISIDSVLVNKKIITFKSVDKINNTPEHLKIIHSDIRNGKKYLLPLGFNYNKNDSSVVYSFFYADASPTYIKAKDFYNKTESYFEGSEQNTPIFKSIILQHPGNDSIDIIKTRNYNIQLVSKYPNSIVLLEQLDAYKEHFPTNELKLLLTKFSKEVQTFEVFRKINEYLLNPSGFNKNYPSFILFENPEGGLDSVKAKTNRSHLIVFWASWCGPCRKEIPGLKKIYEKYSAHGLSITSISVDSDREDWKKALVFEKMPWQQLLAIENSKLLLDRNYSIPFIPRSYLFDAEKKLLTIFDGYDTTMLEKLDEAINRKK